jgi:hypothetical protein
MADQRFASRLSESAARVEVSRMRVAERGDVNDPVLASRWMSLSPRREETASEFSLRVSRTTEPPDGGLLREAFLDMSKSID